MSRPTDPLLRVYDEQVRGGFAGRVPAGWLAEVDGPLVRCTFPRGGFATTTPDLADLSSDDLEALVDRTLAAYGDTSFEWKTYDHDRADLAPLLRERGLVAEEHESLVMGAAADLAGPPALPDGLTLRRARARVDLDRVAALESEVWGADLSRLADDLFARLDDPHEPVLVHLVEDGDVLVSAAWLAPLVGTEVAGLWGGSTLAAYRGRGVYRALVAARAAEAVERGFTVLQVDASDDSRPILERLGLRTVGGTTPYRWTP